MKVVILAGGFGTRLAEHTDVVPKPMVTIGGQPIIWHIMNHYARHGYNEFVVALGYKASVIREYFYNYHHLNLDFTVDLSNGDVGFHGSGEINWKVTLVDTGVDTMTGGRIKRLADLIEGQTFLLTYGDGLSNVDIAALIAHHKRHNSLVTLTAVRPAARFGELIINGPKVEKFVEKPQLTNGWINGGFFVIEPQFIDLIDGDEAMLKREPIEKADDLGKLGAFRHEGFWQCMDTKRDRDLLEKMWKIGAPWLHLPTQG